MNYMVEDIKTMLRNRIKFLQKKRGEAQEIDDKESYQELLTMGNEVQYMLTEVERIEQGKLPLSS